MKTLATLAWLGLLCATVTAQQTLIVDLRGGPGVFLDLPPAVAAASPGDTIITVYTHTSPITGLYHGTVIDKPLKIIGVSEYGLSLAPGRTGFLDKITIRNIPAGAEVLLAYLFVIARSDPNTNLPIPHGIVVENCAGRVHLESVFCNAALSGVGEVRFENCPQLSMHWCELWQGGQPMLFRNVTAAISDCTFDSVYPLGFPLPYGFDWTTNTLRVENSNLRLVDSVVVGANQCQTLNNGIQPPRSCIDMLNSTVELATNALLYGGTAGTWAIDAVVGTGTVVEDPYSNHTGIQSGITVQPRRIPTVYMDRVIRNQPFRTFVMGPPNGFSLLTIGFPLHQGLPFPFGTVMLDPVAIGVLGLGPLDHRGSVQQQWRVPAMAPMDMLFALQAATLSPGGALGITYPSLFSVSWEGGRTWP